MKTETKRFPLDEVLSIVPGNLVAKRHIDAVYDILNWMTNDSLFTHQLPRAVRECEPWLLRWFPELAQVEAHVPALTEAIDGAEGDKKYAAKIICEEWVRHVATLPGIKPFYDVPRIPRDDHDVIDPVAEAVAMVGKDRVIVAEP